MKNKILLVHSGNETFVSLDISFLKQHYHVHELYADKPFPKYLRQYVKNIKQTDVLFCWFASWNSFWAILISKLFIKPSLLVIGGYDTAKLPEIKYGHQRGGVKKYISRWAMRMATQLTSFSYFSRDEAVRNAKMPKERIAVLYLGVPDAISCCRDVQKEQLVLAVGAVDWVNLKRKGWEAFVRAAALLQDYHFVLVGNWADQSIKYLQNIASNNIHFTGRISDETLTKYYQRALIYVQASSHEGFGLSVAEAMLARCIPVVANVGSLPEVVGGCGIYLKDSEPETIASVIKSIPEDNHIGERARQRVLDQFPPQKRIEGLSALISDLLNAHSPN